MSKKKLSHTSSSLRTIDGFLSLMNTLAIAVLANYPALSLSSAGKWILPLIIAYFLVLNGFPSIQHQKIPIKRLKICANGSRLLKLFIASTTITTVYSLAGWFGAYQGLGTFLSNPKLWGINLLVSVLAEGFVFWNGIIHIYTTSAQLGVRYRVLGIVCGWIPIVHLVVLLHLIRTVDQEVLLEHSKFLCNEERKSQQICQTKYPLLMVHGVFFRDFRYLNYWGRIPAELEKNGATIFYGNQQSAASVEECGRELADRIREIVETTGCEKVNIIAHSKGGLDSRSAITACNMSPYVASLTTINTPHRGCEFVDFLLNKIPEKQKMIIANSYNKALKKLGDKNPDFIEAVTDLTHEACMKRNEVLTDAQGVYYQSFGSKLNYASNGRFPLNFSHYLVRSFDGANDGLVGEDSFQWGSAFQMMTVKGKRGISHGDVIDLNRENIPEFDVREFYVDIVADLKDRGF